MNPRNVPINTTLKIKKQILLLMLTLIPAMVLGQLAVNNAEVYDLGTVLKYQGYYANGLTGGKPGANQLWDYSTLQPRPKDVLTVWVDSVRSNDYGKYFPDANLVKIFSDGKFVFIKSTKDANYMVGYVDTVYDTKSLYSNPQLLIKRPLKYKTMAIDTFYRKVTMQAFKPILSIRSLRTNALDGVIPI
jgi:hypothetical protein